MSKFSRSSAALTPSVRKNLPIPFVFQDEEGGKADADRTDLIKLELSMDTGNPF